jgi:hypothetical protein
MRVVSVKKNAEAPEILHAMTGLRSRPFNPYITKARAYLSAIVYWVE